MERKIAWNSGIFDELELVYQKAEKNENIAAMLSEIESGALDEARIFDNQLKKNISLIASDNFDDLPDYTKEEMIGILSNEGLISFTPSIDEPKITVVLGPKIQQMLCCTTFRILNSLEKLDGAFNIRFPSAVLELKVPLGGKKGLFKIEMLIMQLYPWLRVSESSTNQAAAPALNDDAKEARSFRLSPLPDEPPEEKRKPRSKILNIILCVITFIVAYVLYLIVTRQ